jgi:enoyl-CoA hydratase/carnithine racemase
VVARLYHGIFLNPGGFVVDNLILTNERDGILELELNRPAKLNALSDEMISALEKALERFANQPSLRLMLIRANGKYFSAGVEINQDISPEAGGSTLEGRHWYRNKFHRIFDEIEAIEKPIVVAHQGPCLGGALEMSLSCDFRLCAPSASYALPEINIGALPGSGGISRLTRIVGPHWTRWLVMAGEQIDAQQALNIGLVHAVYPEEEFEERTRQFCCRMAQYPYELLGLAKLSIELATDLSRAQGRDIERISNSILFTGAEHKASLQAFLERQAEKRRSKQ